MLAGIRWGFLWQRHQTIATHFARAGYRTIFVETTGLANPKPDASSVRNALKRIFRRGGNSATATKVRVYSPLTLPPTNPTFDRINRRFLIPKVVRELEALLGGERPIVIVYPPTRTSLQLVESLSPRLIYYDCSEEYAGMSGVPSDLFATERELLRRSDMVSCTSARLLERIKTFRTDAFLSGPGVEAGRFEGHRGRGSKVICYFGHLGEDRVRMDVLREIAASGFELKIVGEARGRAARDLIRLPGVDWRGSVPHERLPETLDGADVFVMPYRMNAITFGISPARTYETLATGRPVIAAPIPSMHELKRYVYLAREPQEYISVLRRLEELESPEKVSERRELARENSWDVKFREIEGELLRRLYAS